MEDEVRVLADRRVERGRFLADVALGVLALDQPEVRARLISALLIVPQPESVRRAMASLVPMILETNALLDDYTDQERATITDYLSRTVEVLTRTLEGDDPTD